MQYTKFRFKGALRRKEDLDQSELSWHIFFSFEVVCVVWAFLQNDRASSTTLIPDYLLSLFIDMLWSEFAWTNEGYEMQQMSQSMIAMKWHARSWYDDITRKWTIMITSFDIRMIAMSCLTRSWQHLQAKLLPSLLSCMHQHSLLETSNSPIFGSFHPPFAPSVLAPFLSFLIFITAKHSMKNLDLIFNF